MMVEMKVDELSGPALDWAVSIAEGMETRIEPPEYGTGYRVFAVPGLLPVRYRPAYDWEQCGPLIDKHDVLIQRGADGLFIASVKGEWLVYSATGESRRIAACRAVVKAKLGDVVSVPACLTPH